MTMKKMSLHSQEDPSNTKYDDLACTVVPKLNGIIEANSEVYADGTVTQSELQEVMLFLGSRNFQVKEISVDDGLYTHEKVLFENSEIGKDMNSLLKASTTNSNYSLSQRTIDGVALIKEDMRFSSIFDEDTKDRKSSWRFFQGQEQMDGTNQFTSNSSEEKITLRQLFFLTDFDTSTQHVDSSNYMCQCLNNHKENIDQKGIKQVKIEENDCGKNDESSMILESLISDKSNGNLEKSSPNARAMSFDVTFSNQIGKDKDNPLDAQVEGFYTSDLRCGSASKENRFGASEQQLLDSHFHAVNEEKFPVAATDSDQNLFCRNNHRDLHLYGCCHLSGSKVTSGHIAYSGSNSFRSDSSATSSHSFAFPTLQREWNSSPVRMAKADHRHFRKNWWRRELFCCKF